MCLVLGVEMSDNCGNNVTYAATSVKLEVEDEVESGLLSEGNDVKDKDDVRQDVDAADVKSELNSHRKDMIQVGEEQDKQNITVICTEKY